MPSKILRISALSLLMFVLVACGRGSPKQSASPSDKPVSGGTLTVAMFSDPLNFDPLRGTDLYSVVVSAQVVESLFEVSKDGKIVGRLVETTENPEPNVYIWKLRKGIKFTDGTDFDSSVVLFNIERHQNAVPRSVRSQDIKDITSIEKVDPYTVKVTLKAPDRGFSEKFIAGAGRMFNPKAVTALGDRLPRDLTNAGTGPFKFVKWDTTQIALERNPDYWQKDKDGIQLPYLAGINFKTIPDENARLNFLKAAATTDSVDALAGNPPYKDIADLKEDKTLSVNEIPGIGYSVIEFNTAKAPFDNPSFRRAVSYGIDREQIKKTAFFDSGKVLDTLIPQALAAWYQKEDAAHPYLKQSPANVKSELGTSGGFKFTLQYATGSPVVEQIVTLIQDELKPFGITVVLQPLTLGAIIANGQADPASFDALFLSWSGRMEPDGDFAPLLYTKGGSNFSGFSDPNMDRLIDEGRNNLDPSKAKAAYDQAAKIMNDQQPMVVFANPPQISVVRKRVRNYPQTYNGYWGASDYYMVWKAP